MTSKIILLDTETTSTAKDNTNELIEIAWKTFQKDIKPTDLYVTSRTMQMRPESPCTPAAVVIHGMTQEKVDKFPPAVSILPELATEFDARDSEGFTFASYNTEFDMRILNDAFVKYLKREFKPKKVIDVLRLAKKVVDPKKSGNLKLDTVYYYYALQYDLGCTSPDTVKMSDMALNTIKKARSSHGASIDVSITEVVFNKLWKDAEKVEGKELDDDGMMAFIAKPMLLVEWPWGQHKGRPITEVFDKEYSYVEWFLFRCSHRDQHPDLVYTVNKIREAK